MGRSKGENPGSVAFGERLRRLRGARSQAEFARTLGVNSQQTYARYELGRLPPAAVLRRLAAHLGMSVDALLSDGPVAEDAPGVKAQEKTAASTSSRLATMADEELEVLLVHAVGRLSEASRVEPLPVRLIALAVVVEAGTELLRRADREREPVAESPLPAR